MTGELGSVGRFLVYGGLALVAIGILVLAAERISLPIGRLPGDIVWRGKHTTIYFPLTTLILVNLLIALITWVVRRLS
jgi:hypothetical protein